MRLDFPSLSGQGEGPTRSPRYPLVLREAAGCWAGPLAAQRGFLSHTPAPMNHKAYCFLLEIHLRGIQMNAGVEESRLTAVGVCQHFTATGKDELPQVKPSWWGSAWALRQGKWKVHKPRVPFFAIEAYETSLVLGDDLLVKTRVPSQPAPGSGQLLLSFPLQVSLRLSSCSCFKCANMISVLWIMALHIESHSVWHSIQSLGQNIWQYIECLSMVQKLSSEGLFGCSGNCSDLIAVTTQQLFTSGYFLILFKIAWRLVRGGQGTVTCNGPSMSHKQGTWFSLGLSKRPWKEQAAKVQHYFFFFCSGLSHVLKYCRAGWSLEILSWAFNLFLPASLCQIIQKSYKWLRCKEWSWYQ